MCLEISNSFFFSSQESVSPAFALSTAKLPGTGGITMGNAGTGEAKEDKADG